MANITQLPKTQFSGLEFTNIMEDIHNLVVENPEYNNNWDDFLNSNAGRMLTEIFAWIADQLATRIDWVVNENYIGTATQRSSIIKILKLIGYKFSLPVAAEVPITAVFSRSVGLYTFSPTYIEGSGQLFIKSIQGTDKKGNLKKFEAITFDTENRKYSYKVPVTTNTGTITNPKLTHIVKFYEGETRIKRFISTSNSGQKFVISDSPIIRGSVVAYLLERDGTDINEIELLKVDNFLDSKAQKASDTQGLNAIPYVENVMEDDSIVLEFGPITLLPTQDRRLPEGSEIIVFYRIGGGLDGNITRQSINITEKPSVGNEVVTITLKNYQEGIGGEDSETVDHASYYGPLKIRTAGKTVTPEDYDIILADHTSILLSKSYGYNNIPSDFYDKYGTYFNPLEVWNFIIIKKPGWETILTSKYYLANWGSFNLENRFNGQYWFKNGNFGNQINLKEDPIVFSSVYDYDNQGGKEFKNFVVLSTPYDWKQSIFIIDPNDENNYIANINLKGSITEDQYDKEIHSRLSQLTNHLVYDMEDPYFYGDYNSTGLPRVEIRENIQAYYRSLRDVSSGVNTSGGKSKFILNVDNQGEIIIDLSKGGVSPSIVPIDTQASPYVEGVIDIINHAIETAYMDVHAYQDFGILIPDTTAQVVNLENRDEEDWILRISGINYIVNTGVDQSYDQMLIQMNTIINAAGYEALFVQNRVNITCYDIRIQRTNTTGTVILQDSNDPYDLLVAYGATPLTTLPVSSGDYSNVASKVVDIYGIHIKLTSPNSGSTSTLLIKPPIDPAQSVLLDCFGLDINVDAVSEYNCYGQKALTIIYRDTNEIDFGDFIYEHGTINFSPEDPDFVYLNYIKEIKDTIKLGHYFNTQFDIADAEWKDVDTRLYNTLYKIDPTDIEGKRELFDLDNSDILLRFTKSETKVNSIYVIENEYGLKKAVNPSITSINLSSFSSLTGKTLNIQINDNLPVGVALDGITNIQSLIILLNTTYNALANETYNEGIDFAIDNEDDTITLKTDNRKDGKIIIKGSVDSANTLLFNIPISTNDTTYYVDGDYYLEYNETTDSIDMKLADNPLNLPDIPFYIHYVADRRHEFIDPEIEKIHTDEDDFKAYLAPMKIAGVENVFKRPVFSTFDIKAEVYCSTAIPKQQIKYNVEEALRKAYSISSAEFNKPIIKAEVSKVIMNVPGVRFVEIRYFGPDMTNLESNIDNRVSAGFDEIIVLSDDIFLQTGEQIHGQTLTYNVI